jgi:tripartite-type tricarboxylate transporter receptor subunit TctC
MIFNLRRMAPSSLGGSQAAVAAKHDCRGSMRGSVAVGSMVLAAFASASLAWADLARAEDVDAFYRGSTIKMMIGSSAGGGYDLYGRLVARHLGRQIPGRPFIVPKNMPTASGVAAMRHIYDVAPRDGLTIGTTLRNTFFDPLMYPEQKRNVDPTKFVWLGSVNSETTVCVSSNASDVKSFDDLKTKGMIVGGNGLTSTDVLFGKLLNTVAGTKIKTLIGYPGAAEVSLAMERGELDGRCGLGWDSIASLHPDWLRDKKINILVQFGLRKHPDMPDVPWIMDMAKNDADRDLLLLYLGPNMMGRPFFATPGMPPDRAAALQAAFDATMKDAEFREGAKRLNIALDPMTGVEVADLVAKIYATPKESLAKSNEILRGN